jgi:hypothetical protein
MASDNIQEGFEVFVADDSQAFGAVRQVSPHGRPEFVVYVENAGDFTVPLEAVEAVHSQKGHRQLQQARSAPASGDRART